MAGGTGVIGDAGGMGGTIGAGYAGRAGGAGGARGVLKAGSHFVLHILHTHNQSLENESFIKHATTMGPSFSALWV